MRPIIEKSILGIAFIVGILTLVLIARGKVADAGIPMLTAFITAALYGYSSCRFVDTR